MGARDNLFLERSEPQFDSHSRVKYMIFSFDFSYIMMCCLRKDSSRIVSDFFA